MVNVSAMQKIQKMESNKPSLAAIHTAMARLASGGPALPIPTTLSKAVPAAAKLSLFSAIVPAVVSIPPSSTLSAKVSAPSDAPAVANTLENKEAAPTVTESEEKPSIVEAIVPAIVPSITEEEPQKSTLSMTAAKEEALVPPSQEVGSSNSSPFAFCTMM